MGEENRIFIRQRIKCALERVLDFKITVELPKRITLRNHSQTHKHYQTNFDVLLNLHPSISISVINQLDAQHFCFTISLFNARNM